MSPTCHEAVSDKKQPSRRTDIEVNTLSRPHSPSASEPARDDDPTGVRALLSSLPEPDPMPDHLVERISASLTAEQAQRARTRSSASVTPLLARDRLRRARLRLMLGSAAAAIAIVAVVGTSLFTARQTGTSTTASVANPAEAGAPAAQAAPKAASKAQGQDLSSPTTPGALNTRTPYVASAGVPLIQISLSGTRYTPAGFIAQAEALLRSAPGPTQPQLSQPSAPGPAGTASGMEECLNALGASSAQVVRADVATYQGQPALIIVATTNGASIAYAVGPQCSRADPAVLRPATPLS